MERSETLYSDPAIIEVAARAMCKALNAERAVLEAKIALCNARLAQIDLWLDAAETICPGIISKLGYAVEEEGKA
jgi:hypothetical protein